MRMATITDRKAGAMTTINWYDLDFIVEGDRRFAKANGFTVYEILVPPHTDPNASKANWHVRYDVYETVNGEEEFITGNIHSPEVMMILRREHEQRDPYANIATLIHSDDFATIAMTPDQLDILCDILSVVRDVDPGAEEDQKEAARLAHALYMSIISAC